MRNDHACAIGDLPHARILEQAHVAYLILKWWMQARAPLPAQHQLLNPTGAAKGKVELDHAGVVQERNRIDRLHQLKHRQMKVAVAKECDEHIVVAALVENIGKGSVLDIAVVAEAWFGIGGGVDRQIAKLGKFGAGGSAEVGDAGFLRRPR